MRICYFYSDCRSHYLYLYDDDDNHGGGDGHTKEIRKWGVTVVLGLVAVAVIDHRCHGG